MNMPVLIEPQVEYDDESVIDLPFGLHPKQSYALLTPATEVLYGGAAGGGKSHFFRVLAIYLCALIPNFQVYIFRRKHTDLVKNYLTGSTSFFVMLAPWIEAKLVKYNGSKNMFEFWNGAQIHLCHCQYEKDRYNYQGAEIHLLLIDELTHFTDVIYRFLRSRCRVTEDMEFPEHPMFPDGMSNYFPKIINGSNPGGVGHNWVKSTFIDIQAPLGIMRMRKSEGGMLRQYIPALLEDNPSLDAEQYEGQLLGLGNRALVRAMRRGDWDIVAGGMFDDLWQRDVHVVRAFVIPAGWRIDRSFDWGSSKPFSVGWYAESDGSPVKLPNGKRVTYPRGTVFRIGEWYGWNGKPNEGLRMTSENIARGIHEREVSMGLSGRVRPAAADSSIFDTMDGNSIAERMKLKGILWTPADKSAGSRIGGWEKCRAMLQAALPKFDEDGNPKPLEEPAFFVFERCTQFIRTIPTLPRDDIKADDVDTDAEDHIADEWRYRLYTKRKSGGLAKVKGA